MTRTNLPATARMMERLDALALVTDEPGKITRFYLSDAHKRAIELVKGWFREAGLEPAVDPAGSIHARLEGREPGLPALIIASHIDSVADAGRYDGNLGVLAGLAVVEELRRLNEVLPFALEIIAFGDEEGVRFPQTLTGSRAVAGRFDVSALEGRDRDGISMREALIRFGLDPDAIVTVARKPGEVLAYLELHIEQGPVLQTANQPLGVVTSIASIQRLTATVTGEAGHAGTVPMPFRHDALAAAAEMVLAVEREAQAAPGLVGTVGRIEVAPGAVNVIPGTVTFTLDLRGPDDGARHALVDRVRAALAEIAARRGVSLVLAGGYEEQATPCHPAIQLALSATIEAMGYQAIRLSSGAGHDAMAFERLCPTGMLFLRCKDGISHNPLESITEADADIALTAMLDFVRRLDPAALTQREP